MADDDPDTEARVKKNPEELLSGEIFWRDHYTWLEQSDYRLRPRYKPGWTASWLKTGEAFYKCEDGKALWVGQHWPTQRLLTHPHSE